MFNKSLIVVVTVVGAAASPGLALADSSSVVLYGYLSPDFSVSRTSGATSVGSAVSSLTAPATGNNLPTRNGVNGNVDLIGFRGTEDLGSGLKATWQFEQGFLIDTGGNYQRNAKVGLAGAFGEVFYGFWNTPMKWITYGTILMDPFGATDTASNESIMGSPGFNFGNSAWGSNGGTWGSFNGPVNANFDLYGANSVNYYTPNWAGFSAQLQYSANEGKGRLSPAGGANIINPYMVSGAVLYTAGPLALSAAYEQHKDQFGIFAITGFANSATSSEDHLWRVNAGYLFWGSTTVNVAYERLQYSDTGALAGVTDYRRNAWQVGASHTMGAHTIRARFNKAGAGSCETVGGGCTTSNLGAKEVAVGYEYALSKRTQLIAYYAKIDNESSAQYSFGFGSPIAGGAAAGADSQAIGLGLRHGF